MKYLILLALLCLLPLMANGACVVNTSYAYDRDSVLYRRGVTCLEWEVSYASEASETIDIEASNARPSVTDSYSGGGSIFLINAISLGAFNVSAWSCPTSVGQGATLTCSQTAVLLANPNSYVVFETSLRIPANGDSLPNQWVNSWTVRFFGFPTDASLAIDLDSSCNATNLYSVQCGRTCNPSLVQIDLDNSWSQNSNSGSVDIQAIANNGILVTLNNSANKSAKLTFDITTPKPLADDCSGGGGGGGTSSASTLSFSFFFALISFLMFFARF